VLTQARSSGVGAPNTPAGTFAFGSSVQINEGGNETQIRKGLVGSDQPPEFFVVDFQLLELTVFEQLVREPGVTRPSGVSPLRFSNQRGIQCVSKTRVLAGCASTMRCSCAVPDLGQPTMKTYGFAAISAPAGVLRALGRPG
jgi:hypothetical protein